MISNVSLGSQFPVLLKAFSPAKTSFQIIFLFPLNAFSTAASKTLTEAAQISAPIPSPSIKGIIGSVGTLSLPFLMVIFEPVIIDIE